MKDTNSWHLMPKEDVLRELATDPYQGLSDEEARRRRRKLVTGSVWHVKHTSAGEAALASVFDLATLLLLITAAAAALFDKNVEAGAIAAILVCGGLARAIAYIRACRIFEDAAKERIPVVSVIRGGNIRLLRAPEIVPGDILFLEAGDTVPCDGRVVTGSDSVVAERGITDNKSPVHKYETVIETEAESGEVPCEFRTNMLFAGSLVLSGSVRMAATACGNRTLVSMKQGGIEIEPAEKLELIEKLRVRSRNVSLLMLACVMVLTALSLFAGEGYTLPDVFLGTMAMAVAAMSEFLTTIGTIILAVTVRDCASTRKPKKPDGKTENVPKTGDSSAVSAAPRERAVIRTPADIGRIADPGIMVFCGSGFFKSGRAELYAYRAKGIYVNADETADDQPDEADPDELIALALAAAEGTSVGMTAGGASVPGLTERARLVMRTADAFARKTGRTIEGRYPLLDHRDMSYPMAAHMDVSLILRDGGMWLVSCGSAEAVLACCSEEDGMQGTCPMTESRRNEILSCAAELETGGAKVMAVALHPSPYSQLNRLSVLTQQMIFVGFFALSQEPEEGAADNLAALRRRGVIPVLFTETPVEDRIYGSRLGLFDKTVRIVRSADLEGLTAADLTEEGMIVSFADIGSASLAAEYSRAMKTLCACDGVPDVCAVGREAWDAGMLAQADWGIAAAKSWMRPVPDSLARHASAVIYPSEKKNEDGSGGLAGICRAVVSSRQALCNIGSAKRYLTLSQCARLVLIAAAVLFRVPLISAVFILIWGLLFDFGAVLAMAFAKPKEEILPKEDRKTAALTLLTGVLWGALMAGLIPLTNLLLAHLPGTLLPASLTEGQGRAILSAACLLSALVCAAETGRDVSLFRSRRRSPADAAVAAFAVIGAALICLWSPAARIVGGTVVPVLAALFALIPALLILAAAEGTRAFRKKKTEPKNQTE